MSRIIAKIISISMLALMSLRRLFQIEVKPFAKFAPAIETLYQLSWPAIRTMRTEWRRIASRITRPLQGASVCSMLSIDRSACWARIAA